MKKDSDEQQLCETILNIVRHHSFWEDYTASVVDDIPETIQAMQKMNSLTDFEKRAKEAIQQKFLCFFKPLTRSDASQAFYKILATVSRYNSCEEVIARLDDWKEKYNFPEEIFGWSVRSFTPNSSPSPSPKSS